MNTAVAPYKAPDKIYNLTRAHFDRVVLASRIARFFGAPEYPLSLNVFCKWFGIDGWQPFRLEKLCPLQVIGAKEGCVGFDGAFRPKDKNILRSQWEIIAMDWQMGKQMPELELYQYGDAHFVQSREAGVLISVLRAFGVRKIEAHIIWPTYAQEPPPTLGYVKDLYWQLERERK